MDPDVASKRIPAVRLTATASPCQPLANQHIPRGSPHAVHTAQVVHQVVKVVEVLVAKYTASKPLALVVCRRSHPTHDSISNPAKMKRTKTAPCGEKLSACRLVRDVQECLLLLQTCEREPRIKVKY